MRAVCRLGTHDASIHRTGSYLSSSCRDGFKEMLDTVKTPFPECVKILRDNIKLDPYFKDFYKWALEHNVPVIILSSGMGEIIRALLVHIGGPNANKIQLVSNEVQDRPGKHRDQEGGWDVKFHDDRSVLL